MNRAELAGKLNEIFKDVFDDEELEISDEMTADDVDEWDSLTHMELIATIEKSFGIHFSLGEINGFKNVGELIASIEKHLV